MDAGDEAWALIQQKEAAYRELFAPVLPKWRASGPLRRGRMARGLKVAWARRGTFTTSNSCSAPAAMDTMPHAVVRGDEGLPGKPEPAIFLEAPAAWA
jgi:beta-phosphoglucomutase-like phosphatase (HAD superfamily)